LLRDWDATWQELARPYRIDRVANADRILRVPGTFNRKLSEPRLVTIHNADWSRRYNPTDFDPYLTPAPVVVKPERRSAPRQDSGLPGDAYNAVVTGDAILEALGFQPESVRGEDRHYTRPGKDTRLGSSATVYADGHTTIWSSTVAENYPGLKVGHGYDSFGVYAGSTMVVT
jgi:hypothetical protein